MMMFDVYSIATTRQAELERMLRRKALLRDAGYTDGPSMISRLTGLARRFAGRERVVRPAASPAAPIYCLTTRAHEPV